MIFKFSLQICAIIFSAFPCISTNDIGFFSEDNELLKPDLNQSLKMFCDYYHKADEMVSVRWLIDLSELNVDNNKMTLATYQRQCPSDREPFKTNRADFVCFRTVLWFKYICPDEPTLYHCQLMSAKIDDTAPIWLTKNVLFEKSFPTKPYLSQEMLTFTKSSNRTCLGSNVTFYCRLRSEVEHIQLVLRKGDVLLIRPVSSHFNPCINKTENVFNNSEIFYEIPKARHIDSGAYHCFDHDNEPNKITVHLHVEVCGKAKFSYVWIFLSILTLIFVLIVIFFNIPYIRDKVRPVQASLLIDTAAIVDRHKYRLCIDFKEQTKSGLWQNVNLNTLKLGRTLGSGEFGTVYLGQVFREDGRNGQLINVAVKLLKLDNENGSSPVTLENDVMCKIGEHKHIIKYIGSIWVKGQLAIVMEYTPLGSLLNAFLRRRQWHLELSCRLLCQFGIDIALGMDYLASINLVHRDLAARNVLVTTNWTLKIADFGLTREVVDYYRQSRNTKVPVRWLAPECIIFRKYSTLSDVWAFGIVLWEICSLGNIPYPEVKDASLLLNLIITGLKNTRPEYSNDSMFAIMTSTWMYDPQERPLFSKLLLELNRILPDCSVNVIV